MPLERELRTYRARLPDLLVDQGKFVVIRDDEVIGVYGDYEDALRVGYERCGTRAFLVKRIEAVETINHFTRDLSDRCHT